MLFCRVTLGKSFLQFSAMKMAHAPPGHHSVIGRPSVNGLAYAEYVIYRGEQVNREKVLRDVVRLEIKNVNVIWDQTHKSPLLSLNTFNEKIEVVFKAIPISPRRIVASPAGLPRVPHHLPDP